MLTYDHPTGEAPTDVRPPETRAVVLGASMAGLLAAAALSRHFDRVTLIDRDFLRHDVRHVRRGVPHARHLHGLHPRGMQAITELLPGIDAELTAAGAVEFDLGQARFVLSGHRFASFANRLPAVFMTRPFLEAHVRQRVRTLPGVHFLENAAVVGLRAAGTGANARVDGVRITVQGCAERTVPADLVVDATGRGSRTPHWLVELGFDAPAEERVEIGLRYATRTFRLAPGALDGRAMAVVARTVSNTRSGVLAPMEGGAHLVTLVGRGADSPPTDVEGFRQFAASLAAPDIAQALAGATPLDTGATFRFPASVRRRFERLMTFPAGLLVIGDAVCSFNPVYGQGMSVAALQALSLRDLLAGSRVPTVPQWFSAIATVIDSPWQVAVGADLGYPDVVGTRTRRTRLINRYMGALHAAASTDPVLSEAFARVIGLLDPPQSLLRPGRALRVLRHAMRGPSRPAPLRTPVPDPDADLGRPAHEAVPVLNR